MKILFQVWSVGAIVAASIVDVEAVNKVGWYKLREILTNLVISLIWPVLPLLYLYGKIRGK